MKRKLPQTNDDESRLSKILFNNTKNLADKLKTSSTYDELETGKKPAWIDEDDDKFGANIIPQTKSKSLYTEKLKQKYESLMGTPSWAKLNKQIGNEDEDADILKKVGHIQKKKIRQLKQGFLEIKKFPKINFATNNEGPIISCVEFHPKMSVALVAGQSGVVSLFSIGGDTNNKLHSFKLKKWKIHAAHFTPEGSEAFLASKQSHSYCIYDLVKAEPKLIQLPQVVKRPVIFQLSSDGKYIATSDGFDEIYLISSASRELLRALKHNTNVVSVSFSHDCSKLYCYCVQGEITIWDLSTYRAIQKFYDSGCVTASCLTTSACGRLLATGSGEGIVNIYNTTELNTSLPLPQKVISNLTTKITCLRFNPSTEILAAASSLYPNSLKCVHIPSYHVYMNIPQQTMNLNQVEDVNFSPNSGYMAVSNNKGSAYLYRLKYYRNY